MKPTTGSGGVTANSYKSGHRRPKDSVVERRKLAGDKSSQPNVEAVKEIKVALYLRVSSDRSVQSDLSLPDQEAHLRRVAEENGWIVAAVYSEPGVSAKTANRPSFQRMIAEAQDGSVKFTKILVHSTSRFARNLLDFRLYENHLSSLGIELVAVTQNFSKDSAGIMTRSISALFDEFHSIRSAEDSIRARKRLVETGYWPGGVPPIGYVIRIVQERPLRRQIFIDDECRGVVELIYRLTLYGDGDGPPLGVLASTKWLIRNGYRTREGARWSSQAVHRVLTNPAYDRVPGRGVA